MQPISVRLGLGEKPPFEPPLMHPEKRDNVVIYGMPTMPVEVSWDEVAGLAGGFGDYSATSSQLTSTGIVGMP